MSESLFTPERDDRDEVIAALQASRAECARLRVELDGDGVHFSRLRRIGYHRLPRRSQDDDGSASRDL